MVLDRTTDDGPSSLYIQHINTPTMHSCAKVVVMYCFCYRIEKVRYKTTFSITTPVHTFAEEFWSSVRNQPHSDAIAQLHVNPHQQCLVRTYIVYSALVSPTANYPKAECLYEKLIRRNDFLASNVRLEKSL